MYWMVYWFVAGLHRGNPPLTELIVATIRSFRKGFEIARDSRMGASKQPDFQGIGEGLGEVHWECPSSVAPTRRYGKTDGGASGIHARIRQS
jgi:hypothetical protein